MAPDVSVIIPVYNVEKWLRECLDSVCGQSLRNIEIVCINDGSPDHSLEIMKEYAARDDRFLIIDKQNEGVGAARNDGIRAAHGEFVAFMDPDDKYPDSDTLRLLYDAAKEHVWGGFLMCRIDAVSRFSVRLPVPGICFSKRVSDPQQAVFPDVFKISGSSVFCQNHDRHGILLCRRSDDIFIQTRYHEIEV